MPVVRSLVASVVLVALGLTSLGASAAGAFTVTQFAPNAVPSSSGWTLQQGTSDFSRLMAQPRNWAAGADAGSVVATEAETLAGPAGELTLGITEAIGADGVAAAVVGCAVSVVCAGGVVGIAAVLGAYRLHGDRSDGQVDQDPGVLPIQGGSPVFVLGGLTPEGSAGEACAAYISYLNGDHSNGTFNMTNCTTDFGQVNGATGGSVWVQYSWSKTTDGSIGTVQGSWYIVDGLACPTSVPSAGDANTQVPIPVGAVIGSDGKCPAPQANWVAISAAAAAQIVSSGIGQGTLNAGQVAAVGQVVDQGGVPATGTVTTSGPATTTGASTTTTTTGPDGTSTATVTPTQHYTYNGPQVTYTTTTTTATQTTAPDGTTTTSTTTTGTGTTGSPTTGTGTGTGGTSTSGDDTPDLCALHPDALACDTLGTPDGSNPQWTDHTVTFAPEDIGMPSGCPAPRSFVVHGIAFVLNYQPACDVAPVVSAGLVAFCALGCALWIMSVVKA